MFQYALLIAEPIFKTDNISDNMGLKLKKMWDVLMFFATNVVISFVDNIQPISK